MLRKVAKRIITTLESSDQSIVATESNACAGAENGILCGESCQPWACRRTYLEAVDKHEKQCLPHCEMCKPRISMGQFGK
jgi:hypothetical protein